jgi:hypothetical protein
LYGTEAANGVINIITKKGRQQRRPLSFTTDRRELFRRLEDALPAELRPAPAETDAPAGSDGPVEALNFDSLLVGAVFDRHADGQEMRLLPQR